MKAKWLHEVQDLLNQEQFRAWFDDLEQVRIELKEAVERYEELLTQVNVSEFRSELAQKNAIDTLYRASEYEDAAAQMNAEATDLENKAMENLGTFEEQRVHTSEIWFKLEALDHDLEEHRKASNAARVKELERGRRKISEEYEREAAKKQRLWEEVEAMWGISLEKNLLTNERSTKGKAVRRQAEKLFAKAEEAKTQAEELRADAEAIARERERLEERERELVEDARSRFDAVLHEDFLYWQQRENNKRVWVSPLISDVNNYNISLRACSVYQCERGRGVDFLEPLIEQEKSLQEDGRLDEFFSGGATSVR
ncbi:MAG: hypothetical protein ABIJ09_06815 [Pseudomonadota bacterium]